LNGDAIWLALLHLGVIPEELRSNRIGQFGHLPDRAVGGPIPLEPMLTEQRQLLLDRWRLVVERFAPEKATILMRRYACRCAHGRRGARAFRTHVSRVATPEEFAEVVDRYFPRDAAA
jgi:tRNA-dihydrouridine synthase